MKKIINSICLATLLLTSCKEKVEQVKPITVNQIQTFVGIGKVVPKDGLISLSVDKSQKVVKVFKKLGDTLQIGDVILEMESVTEQLQAQQSQATYQNTLENTKTIDYEIKQAEIKLFELKNIYEISKKLATKKAETKENVLKDSVNFAQQKQLINQLKQQKIAQQQSIIEQEVVLKASKIALQGQKLTSLQNGILTKFDVKVGEVLQQNAVFGEVASLSDLIIEAEIDEFYASEIKKGQSVQISLVGQTNIIAKGVIDFVGVGLQNKSILYETVGEANDRRVRRFDVKITEGNEKLLINQKVECKILR